MADGNATGGTIESFTDLYDFNSQKEWQPYDVEMNLMSDSLYIPPDQTVFDRFMEFDDHPEAEDDDMDDDDDLFDFDMPMGPAGAMPSPPPPMAMSAPHPQTFYPVHEHEQELGGCSSFSGCTRDPRFASFESMTPGSYPVTPSEPVRTVDPVELQLSRDVPVVEDITPTRFEPASPIIYESDGLLTPPQESVDTYDDPPVKVEDDDVYVPDAFEEESVAPLKERTSEIRRRKTPHGNHRCEMTLPSGEPCHKAFTRPYDLARHQETIHAQVRKMFRCDLCGEHSKTFSRQDALSRHIRMKHSSYRS